MIKAGELDVRIQLFSPSAGTDDGYTTRPDGWTDRGAIYAKHMRRGVREIFENAGRESRTRAVFKVRRYTLTETIDDTWKLNFDGVTYDIEGPGERDDRDALILEAVGSDEPLIS